jgi:two-component system cell cycle sensor histidine kinase/response regulator CckA
VKVAGATGMQDEMRRPRTPEETTSPPSIPTRILVVDDEDAIRHLVERILLRAGYATAVAANGPDALRVAATLSSIDVLVTDMMMPEMTGDELARRMRMTHPSLKVLYFTGYGDKLFGEKGTMWEDEAFLEKPCSPKGLLEAISLLRSSNRQIGDVYADQSRVPSL